MIRSVFFGHGSPMNIIWKNQFTECMSLYGANIHPPTSILCVSAHWLSETTLVVSQERPRQIYDFYGFPEELYSIKYEPAGDPEMAKKLAATKLVNPTLEWGLDHGAWCVLHHLYPSASIPVLQLSLNQKLSPLEHLRLAMNLRQTLLDSEILVLCSGNIVHNLREIEWQEGAEPLEWAKIFEQEVLNLLSGNQTLEEKVEKLFSLSNLKRAHPTTEHFLPLIYALGFADPKRQPRVLIEGIQNGSISMAAIEF